MKYRAVQAPAFFGQTLWNPQRKRWWWPFWCLYSDIQPYGYGYLELAERRFRAEGATSYTAIYLNGCKKEIDLN